MKPIHNFILRQKWTTAVANNPKFRKMKPIHNRLKSRLYHIIVANNPKFRKMKPIHNQGQTQLPQTELRTILNLEK